MIPYQLNNVNGSILVESNHRRGPKIKKLVDLISYTTGNTGDSHSVIFMWSLPPKDLLQLGHLRDLEVRRSSTHSLQKTCPQVLITVSLKLRLQTVQMTRA